MTTALIIVAGVLALVLLAFQGYTLVWQLRLPGGVPRIILALKVLNIVLLVAGLGIVTFFVARG